MDEFEEFAYALLDQLSVELNEESEIKESQTKATEAFASKIKFDEVEVECSRIFSDISQKVSQFTGLSVSNQIKVEILDLIEFKRLKGRRSFQQKTLKALLMSYSLLLHKKIRKR